MARRRGEGWSVEEWVRRRDALLAAIGVLAVLGVGLYIASPFVFPLSLPFLGDHVGPEGFTPLIDTTALVRGTMVESGELRVDGVESVTDPVAWDQWLDVQPDPTTFSVTTFGQELTVGTSYLFVLDVRRDVPGDLRSQVSEVLVWFATDPEVTASARPFEDDSWLVTLAEMAADRDVATPALFVDLHRELGPQVRSPTRSEEIGPLETELRRRHPGFLSW